MLTSSFARDVVGCKKFCRWAGKRHQVVDPFGELEHGRGRRQENLTPPRKPWRSEETGGEGI